MIYFEQDKIFAVKKIGENGDHYDKQSWRHSWQFSSMAVSQPRQNGFLSHSRL